MHKNQYQLLKKRKFLPLFITQFFGAFNDNAYKLAMLTLIGFQLVESEFKVQEYQSLGTAIFTLPFFLFSALAGEIADKYDKSRLIRIIKLFEIIFLVVGTIGLMNGHIAILMSTLFLMGLHSSFFGPIKYSILPDHLNRDEIIGGTALIEASTFIAILLGTLLGSLSIRSQFGIEVTSAMLLSFALIGWGSSFFIPSTKAASPQLKVNYNFLKSTWMIVRDLGRHRTIWVSVIGISWFWLVGAVILTELPAFTKFVLLSSNHIFSWFLALFSIGIAVGSLVVNRLLKGKIDAKYVPISLIGISIFLIDLFLASPKVPSVMPSQLLTLSEFLHHFSHWRISFDLFALSACGGVYIVPLYALLQDKSEQSHRSRNIAANNILNALFMVLGAVYTASMAHWGASVTTILCLLGGLNLFAGLLMAKWITY